MMQRDAGCKHVSVLMGHCLFGLNEALHQKKNKKSLGRRRQLPGHFGVLTIMGALLSPFSLLRFMVRLFEKVEAPFKDNALSPP